MECNGNETSQAQAEEAKEGEARGWVLRTYEENTRGLYWLLAALLITMAWFA